MVIVKAYRDLFVYNKTGRDFVFPQIDATSFCLLPHNFRFVSAFSDANIRVFYGTKGELIRPTVVHLPKLQVILVSFQLTGFECQTDEQSILFCLLNSFQQCFAF